ncbi:MAG: prolyl oligopeptidase family serine peptidase [Pirellulales bacterium]|nr:prolyl oligopeptidase family serine peptidase [Pirellulales bacterium]
MKAAEAGKQQEAVFEKVVKVQIKYLIYLPDDYAKQDSWPLMIFLHGAGERGDHLDRVKVHGPPKLIAAGRKFPFLVVSPQCPKDKWWDPRELRELLDDLVEKYKIDRNRIYLTGLSMGGFGAWAWAAEQPRRFAAIVPICGGGDPEKTRRFGQLPVWVFHGGKDPVVRIEQSEKMVEALKKNGGNVKFTVYPDAGHDSWTEAYDDPKLYEWLLEQKRSDEAAKP